MNFNNRSIRNWVMIIRLPKGVFYLYYLLVILLAIAFQNAIGQVATVTGTVLDKESNLPLPGVNVIVQGTTTGAVTDFDGKFSISVNGPGTILSFSFIGFKSQQVAVGSQAYFDVLMETGYTTLSDVVITGTGVPTEKRKTAFTIETVDAKDLPVVPTASIDQALIGKIPGALIMSGNGSPGSNISILLRGINSINSGTQPMILLNGVQIASTNLNSLDLSTIDKIEVVQGAAAASIYGAQGANGVIQIFTKKGTKGRVAINFTSGIASNEYINIGGLAPAKYHGFLTNSDNYVIAANGDTLKQDPKTLLYNQNVVWAPQDTSVIVNKPYDRNLQYHNHIKEFYQSALTYNNSLSISGGGDNSDFNVSISNTRQENNFKGDGYNDRTNLILNTGIAITPKLFLRPITQLVYTKNTVNIYNKQGFNANGLIYYTLNTRPFADLFLKDEEGNFGIRYGLAAGVNSFNPNYSFRYTDTQDVKTDIIQSIQLTYKPIHFVNLDLNYGINHVSRTVRYQTDNQSKLANSIATGGWDGWFARANTGEITTFEDTRTSQNFLGTATVNLDLQNDLGLNLPILSTTQLAYDYRNSKTHDYDTYGLGLPLTPPITVNQATTFKIQTDQRTEFITYGYLINQRFEWRDLAGISGGFRSDYSSAFGSGSKPFTFPRADGFVRISAFSFFDDSFLSRPILEWKLRAAFGKAGIQPQPFDRFPTLTPRTIGNTNSYYIAPNQSNPNLDVEVSTEFEAGTDIMFYGLKGNWIKNIRLNFTWWKRSSDNNIFQVDLAPSSGVSRLIDNAFALASEGLQASLNFTAFKSKRLNWTFTTNFGTQTSKITSVEYSEVLAGVYILKAGEKVGQLYGYKLLHDVNAINPNTGQPFISETEQVNYEVASNGWVVDKRRKVPYVTPEKFSLGDPFPDFNASFISDVTFNGYLSAGVQFDWIKGGNIFNDTKGWLYRDGIHPDFAKPVTINGRSAAWASFYNGVYNEVAPGGIKNYFYEDGSFVRLRNAYLGCDLAQLLKVKGVKKLQLLLAGRNLITWTDYSGMDPEISSVSTSGVLYQRIDSFVLPNQRSYQITLNIGL